MTSTREHWFAIEQTMSDIRALLEKARAEALLGTERSPVLGLERPPAVAASWGAVDSPDPSRSVTVPLPMSSPHRRDSDGPAMNEPLFGRPLEPSEATGARLLKEVLRNNDGVPPEPERDAPGDIVALRIQVRERLTWLRSKLGDDLSTRDAYQVLFPLVVHIDELTAVALGPRACDWRQLQGEFFDIDDGGELFFQKIDELLVQDDTHPLAFEVYYYCLGDGFVGRFGASPSKLGDYTARLEAQIPNGMPPVAMNQSEVNEVRLVEFPYRYYLISAAAVLTVFLLLHVFASLEVGSW